MAVIIGSPSSPYDYQPYNNNNPSQVQISQWQLSPGASISVLVCLPITALLFFMIGVLVGIEREKRRNAAAKKRNNADRNQNGGGGQGGYGGGIDQPAPPLNGNGNLPGNAGHNGNNGQVGNPGQAGPGQVGNLGQAVTAA